MAREIWEEDRTTLRTSPLPRTYRERVVFTVLAFFSVKKKQQRDCFENEATDGSEKASRISYVQHASKTLYYGAPVIKVLPYPSPLLISSAFNCYSTACVFTSTKEKKWYMVGW